MMENGIIIPAIRYKDAPMMLEWLCKAFGFEKHLVVPGEDNTIAHAQLTFKNSMIMMGSERDNEYGRHLKSPGDVGDFNTQSPYIIVEEIDEHYERAKAAGAEMILDLKEEDYGGKAYSCKDPEGHIWNFGSYNPWET